MTSDTPVLRKAGKSELPVSVVGGDGYNDIYVYRGGDMLTSRWKLSWRERWKLLWSGNLYLQQLTFKKRMQPIKLLVDEPMLSECTTEDLTCQETGDE